MDWSYTILLTSYLLRRIIVKASIEYCVRWRYEPRAVRLADQLKETFSAEVELIKGDAGAFEIVVDGNLIFSKMDLGRFPEEGEVVKLLQ